jgi:hypothetical protein
MAYDPVPLEMRQIDRMRHSATRAILEHLQSLG